MGIRNSYGGDATGDAAPARVHIPVRRVVAGHEVIKVGPHQSGLQREVLVVCASRLACGSDVPGSLSGGLVRGLAGSIRAGCG